MEKLGKILLSILNISIDVFLVMLAIVLVLWMIFGITPKKSVQTTLIWIEESWNYLWEIETKQRNTEISPELHERARRQIYVAEPNKRGEMAEDIITQPYK